MKLRALSLHCIKWTSHKRKKWRNICNRVIFQMRRKANEKKTTENCLSVHISVQKIAKFVVQTHFSRHVWETDIAFIRFSNKNQVRVQRINCNFSDERDWIWPERRKRASSNVRRSIWLFHIGEWWLSNDIYCWIGKQHMPYASEAPGLTRFVRIKCILAIFQTQTMPRHVPNR